jgi:hypothetical protein
MRPMRQIHGLSVALFILGAMAATAQAVEGPFYHVGGARLTSGSSKTVKAAAVGTGFVLENKASKINVKCKSLKFKAGALITGSNGANASGGKGVFEYTNCTVEKNGTCEVENETVTTNLMIDTLGYKNIGRTGPLLVWFKPETGNVIATIKFTGVSCIVSSTAVVGSVIGTLFSGGAAIEVGKNNVETLKNEVRFSNATEIWIETAGTLSPKTATLESFGGGSTLGGSLELTLEGGLLWGVFT